MSGQGKNSIAGAQCPLRGAQAKLGCAQKLNLYRLGGFPANRPLPDIYNPEAIPDQKKSNGHPAAESMTYMDFLGFQISASDNTPKSNM